MKKKAKKSARPRPRATRRLRRALEKRPPPGKKNRPQRPAEPELRELIAGLKTHQEEVRIQNLHLIESQKLLEDSRDRYADLYDSLPVPYVTLDETGAITNANLRGAELLGVSRPSLIQIPLVHFVHKNDKRLLVNHLHACRSHVECRPVELTLATRSGKHIPVQLLTTLGLSADSSVMRLYVAIIDLTDQKRAQEERERLRAAQQNEILLRDILESLPVSVRLVDSSGRLVIENEASRSMFGGTPAVPGVTPYWGRAWSLEAGAPLMQRQWPVSETLQNGAAVIGRMIEIEEVRPGPRKAIRSSAVPLTDPSGKLMGVVLVNEDLTEIRAAYKALQEAKEAAEAASRLKDEFLATLSHELRTPISAILLWTHLLQTSVKDEDERAAAFETILSNAKLQSQLINDLLDLSRVASAKMQLNLRPQFIDPVIHSAIESVRPSAQAKQVALEARFDVAPVAGRIDAVRIEQVLLNLLSNAINFTPPQGKITVSLHQSDKLARIQVTDTGKGMSPSFLPYAFDRFRQAEGGSTRSHGGLGLGLAIARELVLGHSGTINAHSDGEGRGATFTIELPAIEPQEVRVPMELRPRKSLEGVRVLFVEDEPATRSAVAHILTDAGAEVTASENAHSALEAFRARRPDIIVSDIAMPGKDGYAMLREIRQLENSPPRLHQQTGPVPAVALTAYGIREDAAKPAAGGFNLHLNKPVDPVTLVETVNLFARGTGRKLTDKPREVGRREDGKPQGRFAAGQRKSDPA